MTLEQYDELFYAMGGGYGEKIVSAYYDGSTLYVVSDGSIQTIVPVTVDHPYLIKRGEVAGLKRFQLDNKNLLNACDWYRIQGLLTQEQYDVAEATIKFQEACDRLNKKTDISLPDGSPLH